MKPIITVLIVIASVFCLKTPAFSLGQIEPATLSYQGMLTDSAGVVMSGTKQLQICLYDNPVTTSGLPANGGTAFWCDTYTVLLKNGQFSVVLGRDGNPLKGTDPLTAFSLFNGTTYVGVKVDLNPEMTPRQKLTSVAYAFNAQNAVNSQNSRFADKVVPTNYDSIIPAGSVIAFAGNNPPPGWLLCDGRSLLISTYQNLYSAISTSHGAPDATHFNLPDYRGIFLRGVDNTNSADVTPKSTGRDPDILGRTAMNSGGNTGGAVGSVQPDDFKSHSHTISVFESGAGSTYHNIQYNYTGSNTIWGPAGGVADAKGGSESRPKNAYVNWIIKY